MFAFLSLVIGYGYHLLYVVCSVTVCLRGFNIWYVWGIR